MDEITGKTLVAWGYEPGDWFGAAIAAAEQARHAGAGEADIRTAIDRHLPAPAATLRAAGALAHRLNIASENADEVANVTAVEQHMVELMRVPTVRAGAVMPDACPAGSASGTIPVRRQIVQYGLAEIVDEIVPLGCIMAGEWKRNAPWRRGRSASAPTSDEG